MGVSHNNDSLLTACNNWLICPIMFRSLFTSYWPRLLFLYITVFVSSKIDEIETDKWLLWIWIFNWSIHFTEPFGLSKSMKKSVPEKISRSYDYFFFDKEKHSLQILSNYNYHVIIMIRHVGLYHRLHVFSVPFL